MDIWTDLHEWISSGGRTPPPASIATLNLPRMRSMYTHLNLQAYFTQPWVRIRVDDITRDFSDLQNLEADILDARNEENAAEIEYDTALRQWQLNGGPSSAPALRKYVKKKNRRMKLQMEADQLKEDINHQLALTPWPTNADALLANFEAYANDPVVTAFFVFQALVYNKTQSRGRRERN